MTASSPGANRAGLTAWLRRVDPLVIASLLYLKCANDGRLYWHDVRYLYATARYSLGELFAGVWNPQYGEALDPAASGGFYLVKFSLLAGLKGLFAVWPADRGGFEIAVGASLGLVLAGAWIARSLCNRLRVLLDGEADASAGPLAASGWLSFGSLAALLLLLSPAVLWLGGKLLGEALALPGAVLCGVWLLRPGGGPIRPPSVMGAAVLVLHVSTIGARPNFGVVVPALCLALAWDAAGPERRAWCGWAAALVAAQALAHAVLFAALGPSGSFFGYLGEYVAGSRPWLVSLVGAGAAVGALAPLALASVWSTRRRLRGFFVRWTALTLGPAVAFAALYQVEARYLLPGFVPLAGLAALGVEALWQQLVRPLRGASARALAALAAAAVVIAANGVSLSLLPDEIDRNDLGRILATPALAGGGSTLLVPWAYSDYHYLVTLEPDLDVRFVHVPRVNGELQPYSPEWRARLAGWYGADRLVLDRGALDPLLEARPVLLLWWGVHPPLERLARRLEGWGWAALAERVRRVGGDDHGDQTWVVEEGDLVRIPVAERGMYRLERIRVASKPEQDQ